MGIRCLVLLLSCVGIFYSFFHNKRPVGGSVLLLPMLSPPSCVPFLYPCSVLAPRSVFCCPPCFVVPPPLCSVLAPVVFLFPLILWCPSILLPLLCSVLAPSPSRSVSSLPSSCLLHISPYFWRNWFSLGGLEGAGDGSQESVLGRNNGAIVFVRASSFMSLPPRLYSKLVVAS